MLPVREKEFKDKLKIALKELEAAKKCAVVVSDEVECNECTIHMSSLASLQSKYASFLDKNDELKSRSSLLGACKSYSSLQSELAEKVCHTPKFMILGCE
jgi:stalled ribosome rescue protein Dom34